MGSEYLNYDSIYKREQTISLNYINLDDDLMFDNTRKISRFLKFENIR